MYSDETLLELIESFCGDVWPRGLGNPFRRGQYGYYIANNAQEVLDFMKMSNYKDTYLTAYGYTKYTIPKEDKDNAVIDVIPFDFDHKDKRIAHIDALRLFMWCQRHDIIPRISYSANKGFHLYIDINPAELQYPAETIRRFVTEMHKAAKFNSLDMSIVGDLNRIMRIPGSINGKSNRYCTALNPDTFLSMSLEDIATLSKTEQDFIPQKVLAPYEIELYLKDLDKIVSEEKVDLHTQVQTSIIAGIWNPEVKRSGGLRDCIAFDRLQSQGADQGNRDAALAGAVHMLKNSHTDKEVYTEMYIINQKFKPPLSRSYMDYKINYHLNCEYAPCTFFLKCGNLCQGCNKK